MFSIKDILFIHLFYFLVMAVVPISYNTLPIIFIVEAADTGT